MHLQFTSQPSFSYRYSIHMHGMPSTETALVNSPLIMYIFESSTSLLHTRNRHKKLGRTKREKEMPISMFDLLEWILYRQPWVVVHRSMMSSFQSVVGGRRERRSFAAALISVSAGAKQVIFQFPSQLKQFIQFTWFHDYLTKDFVHYTQTQWLSKRKFSSFHKKEKQRCKLYINIQWNLNTQSY